MTAFVITRVRAQIERALIGPLHVRHTAEELCGANPSGDGNDEQPHGLSSGFFGFAQRMHQ